MQVRTVHAQVTACAHPPAYTPPIFSPLAKGGRDRGRNGKVGVRQRSCATRNAMPKLHLAAPGAVCTHFLALSSSYCIWSRLCALLAQLVHHSSRHLQVGTHRNRLWQPGQTRFSPIYDIIIIWLIESIQSLDRRLKRANQQGTILACYIKKYTALQANVNPYILQWVIWQLRKKMLQHRCSKSAPCETAQCMNTGTNPHW